MEPVNTVFEGTTPPIFLPARPHKWERVQGPVSILIPMSGKLSDLAEDISDESEFVLLDEVDFDGSPSEVLNFNEINKVLFATRSYMALEDDQVFVLSAVALRKDIDKVLLIGNVLRKL